MLLLAEMRTEIMCGQYLDHRQALHVLDNAPFAADATAALRQIARLTPARNS